MDRRSFITRAVAAGGLAWSSRLNAADDKQILPTRPLGKTGVSVTVLALGGYTGMKEPRSDKFDPVEMADAAIDAGIRRISVRLRSFDTRKGASGDVWVDEEVRLDLLARGRSGVLMVDADRLHRNNELKLRDASGALLSGLQPLNRGLVLETADGRRSRLLCL